jgi:hypothetical protein
MVYRNDLAKDGLWFEEPQDQAHNAMIATIRHLRDQGSGRRERTLRLLRMYGNKPGATQGYTLSDSRLRYNLIAQGVDTVISEVTFQEPKVSFLVDGGDWTLKQAAKAREAQIEQQMRDCGFFTGMGAKVMRDGALTGILAFHTRVDWRKLMPVAERVLPLELDMDESDARAGCPRAMFRSRPRDRGLFAAENPKFRKQIMDRSKVMRWDAQGEGAAEEWLVSDSRMSDLVMVYEGWRLPSFGCDEHDEEVPTDGRHIVCVEGLTVQDEAWDEEEFPFAIGEWKPDVVGPWGIGLAADMQADQIELNRTLIKLQETIGAAAGMWLLQKGSKISPKRITDLPGSIVEFDSVPPQWLQPNTFPSDLVQHADMVINRALRRAGINEMAATGSKPAGLDSGAAIREYRDQFSLRQSPHSKVYDALAVALAKRLVACNREIYEYVNSDEGKKKNLKMPEVSATVKRGRRAVLKKFRWEEDGAPSNAHQITSYPVSSLPSNPALRTQTVQDWIGGGLINQDEARALLDFPDTEGHMNLALADHDYALFAFETMVEDGEYVPPEPYQNLKMALELMRRAYLRARIDGAPDARLDLVRDHMAAIDRLMVKATPPPAPAAMGLTPPLAAMPAPAPAGLTEMTPNGMAA